MNKITLNRDQLRDKVCGCWMGKVIGGTLGAPYECCTEILNVQGYSTPPGEPIPNDDLDLQLVWLKVLQTHGPLGINNRVLGEYWIDCIPPSCNEYGVCKANMRAGLQPPLSGIFENKWKDSNGAWIRTEIWACIAPGCPDIAIRYAYEDASVDHGNGEGVYAALFTAAIQSGAFVVSDRDELIRIGLSKIPPDCRVARSISIVLKAHSEGCTWKEARELVVADSSDLGWFQAPANIAFMVIGWMYGEHDFGKSITIATNCGDDTDCTAGTLGSILGIILGRSNIPSEWSDPIGDRIVTCSVDRWACPVPEAVGELTDLVVEQIPGALVAFKGHVRVDGGATDLSALAEIKLDSDAVAKSLWNRSPYAVDYDFVHIKATLDYGRDPLIKPGVPFKLILRLTARDQMLSPRHFDIIWHLPSGWSSSPAERLHVMLDYVEHGTTMLGAEEKRGGYSIPMELTAGSVCEGANRAMLEIRPEGRPTVGLIPVVFLPDVSWTGG